MNGRIRRWATGHRARCSRAAKPVGIWITPPLYYAPLRRYPHAHRHIIKKRKVIIC